MQFSKGQIKFPPPSPSRVEVQHILIKLPPEKLYPSEKERATLLFVPLPTFAVSCQVETQFSAWLLQFRWPLEHSSSQDKEALQPGLHLALKTGRGLALSSPIRFFLFFLHTAFWPLFPLLHQPQGSNSYRQITFFFYSIMIILQSTKSLPWCKINHSPQLSESWAKDMGLWKLKQLVCFDFALKFPPCFWESISKYG